MSNEIQEDPFVLFSKCYTEATEHELNDPDAMSLATVGADGMRAALFFIQITKAAKAASCSLIPRRR
jgi:pyridoxine/pyridoxamine 5'-phosphate oxidase